MRPAFVLLCLVCVACPSAPSQDAGFADDGGPAGPESLVLLDEEEDFAQLVGGNGTVKYLLPVAGQEPRAPVGEACAFQNTARYPYHLPFLNAQPGGEELGYDEYIARVLRRESRVWWGGELLWREDETHPLTGERGVMLFSLYTEDSPGNRLEIDDVRAVHAALSACAPFFARGLAFAPSSSEQRETAAQIAPTLASEGIAVSGAS